VSKHDRWPQRCFLCHRTGGVEAIGGHSLRCTNCHSIWPANMVDVLPTPVLNGWQDDATLALLRRRAIRLPAPPAGKRGWTRRLSTKTAGHTLRRNAGGRFVKAD